MLLYQELADELIAMLREDQAEKRRLGVAYFHETDRDKFRLLNAATKENSRVRAERMLEILQRISAPYLPSVESIEDIDEKRAVYGIGPLRWPKSLAIPEAEQPWLKQPLSAATIRDMTDKEWHDFMALRP